MRVISGSARGLRLFSPKGQSTRPTGDRVKEALFSMLNPYIAGSRVLDLFAGSGALGIEALSRGAERAVFIDKSSQAVDCIKRNLVSAGFEDTAAVIRTDAMRFLKLNKESFDVVFLDPPYREGLAEPVFASIMTCGAVSENGVIAFECPADCCYMPIGFDILRDRIYNNVRIIILSARKGDLNGYDS